MLDITRSHLYLSIGTGLALGRLAHETKHDTEAYIEQDGNASTVAPYTDTVDVLYINVRTLVRNLMSAAEGVSIELLVKSKLELKDLLISEITYIDNLFEDKKVVFYMFDYSTPYKSFNRHVFTKPTKNEARLVLIEEVCNMVDYSSLNINMLDNTYKTQETCMLFTHEPLDLLNSQRYPSTTSIASYTGNVETRTMFHKHYTGKQAELARLPYLEFLVHIIGVRGLVGNRKLKKSLLNLAVSNNWNPSSRWVRIIDDIKKIPELKVELDNFKPVYK